MYMGPISTMMPASSAAFEKRRLGCYKATVNESETINEAQPPCLVRGGSEAGPPGPGFRFPVQCPLSEVRATPQHAAFTNFEKLWALAKLSILVLFFHLKFLNRIRACGAGTSNRRH